MAKKSRKTTIIKKKWYIIKAPKIFNEAKLGETYCSSAEKMIGKAITMSLATITGEYQKQNTYASFIITNVTKGELRTSLTGIKLGIGATKRAIRRNRTKVDDSFLIRTKNKKTVRCKPLLSTKFKATASVATALKKMTRDKVARFANVNDFETMCKDILSRKFQKTLNQSLKKIFPLSFCDIRWLAFEEIDESKVASQDGKKTAESTA